MSASNAAKSQNQKKLWILGSWQDLLLFVATPALILPLAFGVQAYWTTEQIILFVAAFGQLGHHLPGMMRAYGDRDLFNRYKSRFIVAPILLLAICIPAMMANMQAVVLVAAVWGIWHASMQTYGFLRIYDAKVASFAAATRRLDLPMCLSWFATAVLFSDNRMAMLLDFFRG